uniref:uncharacterized protein LOC105349420 n=1 Tax=Fragaria vesca subsp. vesca TaxID=101020 RepID=UPI0005CA30AA|nr:PREDICTED: uncharacterized protein LOC105349420 [Fragaria vesca subsp. vesca]
MLYMLLFLTYVLIVDGIYEVLAAKNVKIPNPEFTVESATMTQLNIEGPQLNATWDITLLDTNPGRRLESHYSHVQAAVSFRNGTLVKQPVRSFVLNRRNHTRVGLRLGFLGQPGEQVVRGISDERKSEVVTFGVRVRAKVWFKRFSGLRRTEQPRGWVLVSCDNIGFEFSGKNGTGEKTSQSGGCSANFHQIAPFGYPYFSYIDDKVHARALLRFVIPVIDLP